MECKKQENLNNCNCSYSPCNKKGICCECVRYHLKNRELPGCFFSDEAEKTWNRTFEFFAELVKQGKL